MEQGLAFDKDEVEASVCAFIKGRMEQMVRDEKVSADTVAAVSAGSVTVPAQYFQLAHALEDARANDREAFDNLATAYARAAHLADAVLGSEVDSALMGDAERVLLEPRMPPSQRRCGTVRQGLHCGNRRSCGLREPIDAFFDEVMVMDEDEALRANRLRLLNRFESVFAGIANIGEMARK